MTHLCIMPLLFYCVFYILGWSNMKVGFQLDRTCSESVLIEFRIIISRSFSIHYNVNCYNYFYTFYVYFYFIIF